MIKALSTCPISDKHIDRLKEKYPKVSFDIFESIEEAKSKLSEAEILLTYGEDLDEENIKQFSNLKWINVLSAGLEKMPFGYLKNTDVLVTNSRGIHEVQMSEYALGVMLMIVRRSVEIYENQRNKQWDRSIRLDELSGKTLGIIGLGAIGSAIAKKAKAFDMRVIGTRTAAQDMDGIDKVYSQEDMDEVLSQSDFVIVLTPLTHKTKNMITYDKLSKFKKSSYFINMSRGAILVEADLIKALENKIIAGAVLDVFIEEPLPEDNPLWNAPNLILTPHLSGRSPKYMERALEIFEHNLGVYLENNGQYKNQIDKQKGY